MLDFNFMSCLTYAPGFHGQLHAFLFFKKHWVLSFYHLIFRFNFISSIFSRIVIVNLTFSMFIFSRILSLFQSVWSMFPSFFQFSLFWQIATQNDVSYEQREVANNKEWSCKWKRNDEIDMATTYFATFQCLTARPSPESWCHEWYSTRHCFARCLIRLQCFFEPWNNKRSHEMPKMQVVCASDAKRPSSLGVLMFSEA